MKSKIIKKFRVQLKNMIHPIKTNTKRYGLRHASVRGGVKILMVKYLLPIKEKSLIVLAKNELDLILILSMPRC